MTKSFAETWNDRYKTDHYIYGEDPNNYLKEHLEKLDHGTILFPAEGEGRNAVFAAKLGWKVSAFDISTEAQKKALQLAIKNEVSIEYQIGEFSEMNFNHKQFDVIALVYAHFPTAIRSEYHKMLDKHLRKGGRIILEAFSKKQIEFRMKNENAGGPKDIQMLFSMEEVKSDFENYEIIELEEKEIELNEGLLHNGKSSVIRFVGQKK